MLDKMIGNAKGKMVAFGNVCLLSGVPQKDSKIYGGSHSSVTGII